jgi:hypothetical protein
MKTSYFQNPRLIAAQKAGAVAVVQISNGAPRWGARPDFHLECLMPPVEIVEAAHAGAMTEADFARLYTAHLDTFDEGEIAAAILDLAAQAAPRDPVLCCFEALKKPGQFCHRRMFADWWTAKMGERIEEL